LLFTSIHNVEPRGKRVSEWGGCTRVSTGGPAERVGGGVIQSLPIGFPQAVHRGSEQSIFDEAGSLQVVWRFECAVGSVPLIPNTRVRCPSQRKVIPDLIGGLASSPCGGIQSRKRKRQSSLDSRFRGNDFSAWEAVFRKRYERRPSIDCL
jgi:hypothetical protein